MYDADTSLMDSYRERQDAFAPLATMADAHREWHANAGVPVGTPGCPQDACHVDDYDDYDTYGLPLVTCGHCKRKVTVATVRNHYSAR